MKRLWVTAALALLLTTTTWAADVTINFDKPLQDWDGFGVNYVEASQTRDYDEWPQDYGGFSTLSEDEKQQIVELIFGADGLRPAIVKMFLDSLHEGMTEADNDNDDPMKINLDGYDHERTTKNMRYFVREGLKTARANGDDFVVIATMYGPQPWVTKQRIVRGRDLDPARKNEAYEYLASWAKYLIEKEGFPVKYISLHNEGDSPNRWPEDGTDGPRYQGHDYNLYWRPEQVADFLVVGRRILDRNGMEEVGLTPGETSHWGKFVPYAQAIADNKEALNNLALITSHGFQAPQLRALEILREKRPELHAWTTSATWGKMTGNKLFWMQRMVALIYEARTNSFTPWAIIQRHSQWTGGDPNPRCALVVDDEGNYEVLDAYYQYKQVTTAGWPGMKVAAADSNRDNVWAMAFDSNGTNKPDAFIVFNDGDEPREITIAVEGADSDTFAVARTVVEQNIENFQRHGDVSLKDGRLEYAAPAYSVTTFWAE